MLKLTSKTLLAATLTLPFTLQAKCGGSTDSTAKTMKCAAGKCGASMKAAPKKSQNKNI